MTTCLAYGREEILGAPSHHQISDLGVAQYAHDYDPALLNVILEKALAIKAEAAARRHLGLNYIRAAHRVIPEIEELVHWPGRLDRLEALAGVRLEPYPISVISTIITFTSATPDDGSITWHTDGVPVTELVPLLIRDTEGGELEIFRGPADEGLARQARREPIPEDRLLRIAHKPGHSVVGQLMRVMHRVRPMSRGLRVTLNLNLRSAERPYIDDNTLCYLAADNPELGWQEEYVADVRARQLPAYLAHQGSSGGGYGGPEEDAPS